MCIVIVCYPVCDIMHFEIYLSFFIKPFFNTAKSSEQKLKYLKNEKVIYGEKKSFFVILKGLSVVRNCLRPESAPLTTLSR